MIRSIRALARHSTAALLTLALLAAACGGSESDSAETTTSTSAATALAREDSDATASTTTSTTIAVAPSTTDVATTVATATTSDCPVWDGALGQSTLNFQHRDLDRTVVVHVPDGPDLSSPMPVVFNFHGLGGRGESQMAGSRFGQLADRDGWLIIAPDGVLSPRRWPIEGIDAEGPASFDFVDALIEWVGESWCIDRDRLYATGFSYGGLMTSALACQRPTTFAAFAPVGLTTFNPSLCTHDQPVSLLSFHGTADAVVPFDGRPTLLDPEGLVGDIATNVSSWAAQNDCAAEASESVVAEPTTLRSWACDDAEVGLHIIEGGAHQWPRPPEAGIDATEIIWDFFGRHIRS